MNITGKSYTLCVRSSFAAILSQISHETKPIHSERGQRKIGKSNTLDVPAKIFLNLPFPKTLMRISFVEI